jgi:gamma-polyglutamate biosynthesis protein CapC
LNNDILFIGLAAALLVSEFSGFLPGGLVVPAFAALYSTQPLRLAGSLAAGLLALGSYVLLSRFFLLFGRRRFVLMIVLGAGWSFGLARLAGLLAGGPTAGFFPEGDAFAALLPGLLANACERQGLWMTLAAFAAATGLTLLAGRLLGLA